MITTLRRFYRNAFCPIAKGRLLELFERGDDLGRAVVMTETSPLSGITVQYVWEEFPKSGRVSVSEFNHRRKTWVAVEERQLPKAELVELFEQIDRMDGAHLGNFSGKAKDGVVYGICWGRPPQLVSLTIRNPQIGSEKHQHFVRLLKDGAAGIVKQPGE